MSNDNAIRVSFSVLSRPPRRDRSVFVEVHMKSTLRRADKFEAHVGGQALQGVLFRPNGTGFVGYLPRLPARGDALVLKSGLNTFNTGVRFEPPNLPRTASVNRDDLVWGQEINEARAVRTNARAARWFGWNAHRAAINTLIAHSGSDERAFARAVGAWQVGQGMTEDGIIDACTWSAMRPLIGVGPATPCVTAIRFRNAGVADADNCCALCPPTGARATRLPLGVGVNANGAGPTGLNGMELRFTISGHASGWEYDIQRTRRNSIFSRTGGAWTRLNNDPMGTWDDNARVDECLTPRGNQIFSIDTPGFDIVLPTAAPAGLTDLVLRASFAEWVNARNNSLGVGWTRISLPRAWSTITWLRRNAAGNLVLNAAASRIASGQIPAATIRAHP